WTLNPEEVGIESQTLNGLVVADATASLKLIKDALSKNKSDIGEVRTVVNSINSYGDEQGGLWSWFKVNHDAVFDRLGKSSAGRFPAMFSGAACTQQQAAQ
ncbi:hypothetical protein ACFMJ1_24210, partial [Acinetobacter baumannii]